MKQHFAPLPYNLPYKFMQKRLHGFELKEVDKARVEAQAKTRTLIQRDRHDQKAAVWVDAAQPDRRNELYGNWFSQVSKLSATKRLNDSQRRTKHNSLNLDNSPRPVSV